MLIDGITLAEGSEIVNAVVDSGTTYPSSPNVGELFFKTDLSALHVYDGTSWVQVGQTSSQLNGQSGSYYLDLANSTGTLQVSHGGTGGTSSSQARINLGLQIGTDVQAESADLLAIASLSGSLGYLKKTGIGTWAIDAESYLSTVGGSVGALNIAGDVTPSANNTYRLGTSTLGWKDLYVSSGSVYLNSKKVLQDVSSTVILSTATNENVKVQATGTGNVEFQSSSPGKIILSGPVSITSGNKITDSAGSKVEFGSVVEMNANKITGLGTPTNSNDAATKTYADDIASASTDASNLTFGTVPNGRISSSSVVQHQAALTIAESQITDGALLARNASNETITGTWSFNNPISIGTPTADNHATTKLYVDAIAAGVNPQLAVRAATVGNITLSGTQTVDGVALIAGDRILVKSQSTSAANGVYIVSAGSWTRATDFDGAPTNEVVTGDLVFVSEGTSNANTSFVLVTSGSIIVGTTGLTFSVFSRAGDLVAGNGLVRTGQVVDVVGSAGRIVANADSIDLATVGTAGTYTSVTTDTYGRVTAGTSSSITLSGDVSGSGTSAITVTLATTNASPQADTFRKITVNGKGLVTNTSAVVANDITTALAYTPVNKAGDTMSGFLTLSADPTNALHPASKQYVDAQVVSASAGLGISVVTGNTQTAVSGVLYVLTETTATTTVTLPASPSVGNTVAISNFTTRTDVVVNSNGNPIMQLAENMTLDTAKVAVTLRYINATIGWIII